MGFFSLLGISIVGYSLKNFHRAFLIYVLLRFFCSQFVPFLAVPGLPQIRLSMFCDLMFVAIACQKSIKKRGFVVCLHGFPLHRPILFIVISILFSSLFFHITPLSNAIPVALLEISTFLFICLFWVEVSKYDISFLLKGFFVLCILAGVYGIFEFFNGFNNPLVVYEKSLNPNLDPREALWTYSIGDRMGRGRISSIFAHAIGCGCFASVFFIFFMFVKIHATSFFKLKSRYLSIVFIFLIIMLALANSRGPMLFFAIAFIPFIKGKMGVKIALVGTLCFFVASSYLESVLNVFLSIFSQNLESQMGGGSNLAMRQEQFEAMFSALFSTNALFGGGASATRFWISQNIGILGAESIWINILLNQGFVGFVAYCYMFWKMIKFARQKMYGVGVFIVVAWIVLKTITSTPGFDFSYFMIPFLLMVKIADFEGIFLSQGKNNGK